MISDLETVITPRQLELLALYASGYQLQEIAAMKFLAYKSVQNTLALARERSGTKSLTHLVAICLESGLLRRNGHAGSYVPVQDERVIAE